MTSELTPADKFLVLILRALVWSVENEKIPVGLAALEALFAIRTRIERKELSIADWNGRALGLEDFVAVPYWAFEALSDGYFRYTKGTRGVTLSDALGVGKGQGSRRTTREGVKKFRRNIGLALQVAILRKEKNDGEMPISLEDAYLRIADQNNLSPQTVRRAHNEFARLLTDLLDLID